MPPSALTRSSSSAGLRTAVLNCDHTDPVHCVQFNPKYVMLVAACWTIWATTWPLPRRQTVRGPVKVRASLHPVPV
ncbi:hypothetical protein HPB47_027982 [Ixodes persulcatus]|uniref:Uncharacterized protein n=1 Tax=Ixodes persulcatus TaxID=34615 RepID=A0AC60PUI8_IXOPE|nr:hypothetical protein HPB47_027982 [Ixodes persulcatus]